MDNRSFTARDILGVPIVALSLSQIPTVIVSLIKQPGKKTLFYVNAHCLNLAQKDKEYKKILQKASLVYSGGIGPVLASKILGRPLIERTPTPDFIFKVFSVAEKHGWSLYLLGARENVVKKAAEVFTSTLPKLKITGVQHGYFSEREEREIIAKINRAHPTILLVGMGSPKQEKWINDNKDKLNVKVLWVVGAMFDVVSGYLPRAPVWMQKFGFEWLFRLFQEPRKLWKRYILGNVRFLFLVARELIVQ